MEEQPKKKIKILTLSDHPMSPSGVGTQTKYFIIELLKTGKFEFISFGGAIKHENYQPMKVEGFEDSWTIFPVDGYGNQDTIRSIIRTQKPDILWFMTDPRFYGWLWEIENEVRSLIPMVYYHVWDNFPYPTYNKIWYDSNDVIVTISKVSSDIVRTVSPSVEEHYLPHAIPPELFKKLDEKSVKKFRKEQLGVDPDPNKEFLIFWNSRNARRKQSGSLIFWFDSFVKQLQKKHKGAKATLLMHTEPKDPNGQDLYAIIKELDLDGDFENKNGRVKISKDKCDGQVLGMLYNAADVTLGVSDAEGFGLSTFESLSCGTPIIVTMTGGLQEQVTKLDKVTQEEMLKRNKKNKPVTEYEHGIGLEPAAKAIIGSQDVPFIYEDRLSEKQVVDALMKMYEYDQEKRDELGQAGMKHIEDNYGFTEFAKKWEEIMTNVHEKYGSWENRKNYKSWELKTL